MMLCVASARQKVPCYSGGWECWCLIPPCHLPLKKRSSLPELVTGRPLPGLFLAWLKGLWLVRAL